MTERQRVRKALAVGFQVCLGKSAHDLGNFKDVHRIVREVENFSMALAHPDDLLTFDLIIACLDSASLHDLHYMQQIRETCPRVTLVALFDVQQDLALAIQTITTLLSEFLQSQNKHPRHVPYLHGLADKQSPDSLRQVPPETLGYCLTARQREVLNLIGQGMSNKAIARVLGLSDGTVKLHCMAVFRALRVTNRTQAAILSHALRLEKNPSQHRVLSTAVG